MVTLRYFLALLILVLLVGCKLTEQSVIGKWLSGSDTLVIRKNHSFLFADRKNYYVKSADTSFFDTSFIYSSGQWTLSERTLFMTFNENKKEVFGNCGQLWNWRKFFSRQKLIRPTNCFEPSNQFVIFKKLKE